MFPSFAERAVSKGQSTDSPYNKAGYQHTDQIGSVDPIVHDGVR
jgi:hypothetical protein